MMNKATEQAVGAVNKQFGQGAVMPLGGDAGEPAPAVFPTGSLGLDLALGCGGYPRGRVVELYGPRGAGKATLALHAVARDQALGGVAAYVDAEHAFEVDAAREAGVDVGKLLVSQPDTAEQALDITEVLARSGAVTLVVVDSVGALLPRAEVEGDEAPPGLRARLFSQSLRKLTAIAHRTGTTILFVAHKGEPFARANGTEEGGNALKFYASVRLDCRPAEGGATRVRVAKNKLAPPFRDAVVPFRGGRVDEEAELVGLAVHLGVVERAVGVWRHAGDALGRSLDDARERLAADGDLKARVRAAVLAAAKAGP